MLKPLFFGLLFYLGTLLIVYGQIAKTSFSCDGRVSGYYADVGTGCQVYHMCDGLGRKFSFACPNATLFQQRMLICDHWFMVNCSKSESEYGANLLIGQKGKPFVDDSGQSSFQRTPRPDYAHGKSEKHNAIYQNKVDPSDDFNQVNEENHNLPSRWSTEYNRVTPTENPNDQFSRRQDIQKGQRPRQTTPQSLDRLNNNYNTQPDTDGIIYTSAEATNRISVNFESRFKATTPVYPQFVNESLKLNDLDLAPPRPQRISTIEEINNLPNTKFKQTDQSFVHVNFESNYKATTPVYPTFVDEELKMKDVELSPPTEERVHNKVNNNNNELKENTVKVNFESNFKATTPVYPTFVDDTLKLNNFELSPPAFQFNNNEGVLGDRNNNPDDEDSSTVHVNFASNFKATTPVYPTFVDDSLKTNNFELFSPLSQTGGGSSNQEEVIVNFESNFKATTPVYPFSVEATSPIPDQIGLLPPLGEIPKQDQLVQETTTRIPVNFESNFLATVPNYPLSVEATSPSPDAVGLLPPIRNDPSGRFLNFEPKDIDQEDSSSSNKDTREPSQYYEPPLYKTGYVNPNGALASYSAQSQHVLAPKVNNWGELKKRYSVPDYEFPLDSAAQRGSYDSDLSSFLPRPGGLQKR